LTKKKNLGIINPMKQNMSRFLEELHELKSDSFFDEEMECRRCCRVNAKKGWNFATAKIVSWEIAENIMFTLSEEGITCTWNSDKNEIYMSWTYEK
jgi:hypothetical protein